MKTLKHIGLFFAFLVQVNYTNAQQIDSIKLDTLIAVLTLQQENIRTVNAYNELSQDYIDIFDFLTGLKYAELGLDLSRKIEFKEGELRALCGLGHIYLAYYLDFEKSVSYYDQALVVANELNADEYKIQIYRGYTTIFATQGQYELSLSYNEKAIEIAEKIKDDQTISDLNAYGGNIYEETGDTAKAMLMYEEVVRIESATNYRYSSKAALITVAHYYFLKGDIDKSLKQYRIAMKRFERLKDLRWVAYTHSEMSKVYLAAGILERAEQHGLAGLEIAEDLDLLKEKSDNCLVLSQVYTELKNDSLANLYKVRYDSLMAEINPVELSEVVIADEISGQDGPSETKSQGTFGKLIQIAVMLGLIGVFVFFAGMPKSSKK